MIHASVATVAIILPVTFMLASVAAELTGSLAAVGDVKRAIVFAVPALALAVAATVASGRYLAGRSANPVVLRKWARMKLIGPNAVLVLVPAAVALDRLASSGHFGAPFMVVQAIEFAAGATNVALLALNMRDGLRLRGRRRQRVARSAAQRQVRPAKQ